MKPTVSLMTLNKPHLRPTEVTLRAVNKDELKVYGVADFTLQFENEKYLQQIMVQPCQNNGTCLDLINHYVCDCAPGYNDTNCENSFIFGNRSLLLLSIMTELVFYKDINECASDPCQNNGSCTDMVNAYECSCEAGFNGTHCEIDVNECFSQPCQNNGTCLDLINHYVCDCAPGYNDTNCENSFIFGNRSLLLLSIMTELVFYKDINECASDPCQNNGSCTDMVNAYECSCEAGFNGTHCEIDVNECFSQPCQNNGTCLDLINHYVCDCAPGYNDTNCENSFIFGNRSLLLLSIMTELVFYKDINECASDPCQNNGSCTDMVNAYECSCEAGFNGTHCEIDVNECFSQPCQNNGTCLDLINHYVCDCAPGYNDTNCENSFIFGNRSLLLLSIMTELVFYKDINECASDPCQNNGSCTDMVNAYECSCEAGFNGTHCEIDVNECFSQPCQNNGTCLDLINHYVCDCAPGYNDTNCENSFIFGNRSLLLLSIMTELVFYKDINECASDPCQNNGSCTDMVNAYECSCEAGFNGTHCEIDVNECFSQPCQNNGTCLDLINHYVCDCAPGYNDTNCENSFIFGNRSLLLLSIMTELVFYKDINECASDPCQNNGSCTDMVNAYECSCEAGFNGTHCEIDVNECFSQPCQNNGTCLDLINHYVCDCAPGYNDTNCENSFIFGNRSLLLLSIMTELVFYKDINECASDPCQNNGSCTDMVNAYECSCEAGFNGTHCEIGFIFGNRSLLLLSIMTELVFYKDINECASDPCQNNGSCTDMVNAYECSCEAGFNGTHCEIDVNECFSQPCQNNGTCLDLINHYVCDCAPGYNDTNCENSFIFGNRSLLLLSIMTELVFYKDINECASDPCQNNGSCTDMVNAYECSCEAGFNGTHCEIDVNECFSQPCQNNGTCLDLINHYVCDCAPGYNDTNCENSFIFGNRSLLLLSIMTELVFYKDINECASDPCQNNGSCTDMVNAYECSCEAGFNGTHCEIGFIFGNRSLLLLSIMTELVFYKDINECASDPCQNNGSCTDMVNAYECSCEAGFNGTHCEIGFIFGNRSLHLLSIMTELVFYKDINECASDPCQNNGSCTDMVKAYECSCEAGFNGTHCEIELVFYKDINECASDPCQNNGSCTDMVNAYECSCKAGFNGTHCEIDVNECFSQPCQNNGTCLDLINHYVCDCVPGYNDTNCENNINECTSDPCQNNGSCTDMVNAYECSCAAGFNGTRCEIDIEECASDPCQNNGSCTDMVNAYTCSCQADFNGTHCEIGNKEYINANHSHSRSGSKTSKYMRYNHESSRQC
ncbi:hypothetical protein FSP39_000952 [Pinctada imbricata]|uniref:EGF-like domain-containing protein n=1 Tax=Pinctada imbricata TaxID=66713 RepID=A0AA88Y9N7_PINIB|nr:hypothetical protein FSP39_000952 [Pinctada imbricata]